MRERYSPLPGEANVFRMARLGGGHLPHGHTLPLPEWLEPNKEDATAAQRSGRVPGISVWDCAVARPDDARWFRCRPAEESWQCFAISVERAKDIGRACGRAVELVADPVTLPQADVRLAALGAAERERLASAGEGHSLMEGLKRTAGTKVAHRSFLDELCGAFGPHSG